MHSIEVQGLKKTFPLPSGKGELTAVDGVSFSVAKGEVFGLLGPNGAGKTTTLEIIEGIQQSTSGTTLINGIDTHKEWQKVKQIIGIQLQSSAYYEYLKLGEILDLFGSFYGKRLAPDELLKIVELTEKKKALIKHLSGGQQQRFSLCAALVNDPEIVFLDEPTTGLDPQARRNMWDLIEKIREEGKTIVLTTHYMEEAEFLCDRVGIMDKGKIVALDTPRKLIHSIKSSARIHFETDARIDFQSLKAVEGVIDVEEEGSRYHVKATVSHEVLPRLYKWAEASQVKLHDLEVISANLEDVFLELTGSRLRD